MSKINFTFTGMLNKFCLADVRGNKLKQVQFKFTDKYEISEMLRALDKWGVENVKVIVDALDIPSQKMSFNISLDDYHLFMNVDYAVNQYNNDDIGAKLQLKVMSIVISKKVSIKKGESITSYTCIVNALKNEEESDIRTGQLFLRHKEYDENGKAHFQLFKIDCSECEHFMLGDETDEASDEESDVKPVVYP